MKNLLLIFILPALLIYACNGNEVSSPQDAPVKFAEDSTTPLVADPTTILNRSEIPILCYHQVRDHLPSDSKTARDYIVPVETFKSQMKMLRDNGYQTISTAKLYEYLAYGYKLPGKSIMITFDDTRLDQFTIALPELNKYGFKGVFFIMTVSLGRPGYMSREQVKLLSDEGHTIGSHTWNHGNVKTYTEQDWTIQLDKPAQQLEKITGRKIVDFAYPFGLWNDSAITQLKKRNYRSVFQLAAKRNENEPLYTIRRIIVPGDWSAPTLLKRINNSF